MQSLLNYAAPNTFCKPSRGPSVSGAWAAVFAIALLSGCASTGAASSSARPVLYPNATLSRVGEAQGQAEVNACISRAMTAGLAPNQTNNEVARRAGEGAATGGVVSAVGALISGRNVMNSVGAGLAIGGSAGAVSGAFHNEKPNPVYRSFVQRCLGEKGFDVIGWN